MNQTNKSNNMKNNKTLKWTKFDCIYAIAKKDKTLQKWTASGWLNHRTGKQRKQTIPHL